MDNVFRKAGYIKSGTRRIYPKSFLFFDTESHILIQEDKSVKLPLKLGVAIYIKYNDDYSIKARKVHRFTTQDEFCTILTSYLSKRDSLHVVAHNIAHDIMTLNLVHKLHDLGYDSKPPIINNRLFIWHANLEDKRVIFFDTANYSITSVARLGKDLGFAKLKIDFNSCTDEELFIYCQRDVEVIEKFMSNYLLFIRNNNLGSFTYSLASQALSAWKYRFMEQSIYIHNHPQMLQLERDAYHGGRTECFFIGTKINEKHYYLDINSMYPHCMRNFLLPHTPAGYYQNVSMMFLKNKMQEHYCIAKVELDTTVNAFPLIYSDRLIFPIGQYTTVLHSPELEIAIKNKAIKNILELACYEQSYIFRDYVDFFFTMKNEADSRGDATYRFMAKIYLNSLYGKFAQHNVIRRKLKGVFPELIFRAGGYNDVDKFHFQEFIWFGEGYVETKSGETTHSSPAIAGAITAYARCLLYQFIYTAGLHNALYCDTDSIIVNSTGYNNLLPYIKEKELGYLKIEDQSTRLKIRAPKDYLFGNKARRKGIASGAVKIDINSWEVEQWLGVKSWLTNGALDSPVITKHKKVMKYEYNKGIVTKEGYVTPIVLPLSP